MQNKLQAQTLSDNVSVTPDCDTSHKTLENQDCLKKFNDTKFSNSSNSGKMRGQRKKFL